MLWRAFLVQVNDIWETERMASVSRDWARTQCSGVCRCMSPIHLIHNNADMNEIKSETTTQLANEWLSRSNIGPDKLSRSSPAKVKGDRVSGDTLPRQLRRLSKLATIGNFEQALNDIKISALRSPGFMTFCMLLKVSATGDVFFCRQPDDIRRYRSHGHSQSYTTPWIHAQCRTT